MQLTRTELRELADSRSWERGVEYFKDGRVHAVVQDGATVVASVQGQEIYRVQLSRQGNHLLAECSCPVGRTGAFCKHCVAVGLACADDPVAAPSPARIADAEGSPADGLGEDSTFTDLDRIRDYLAKQDLCSLVEILVEQALSDENLLRRLTMAAARGGNAVDLKAMRRAITEATRTGGFVGYHFAHSFARGIEDVVGALAALLQEGSANEVITLSEYALRRVEQALGNMDDSDGHMRPILDDLQTLHHAACVKASPDPVRLARHLFEWEMTGDWDTFFGAAKTYADVFGEKGLAEYRRLAESRWQKVPRLGPGQESEAYDGSRFRLTTIMEDLASASGDVETLVAVKSRDLSDSLRYLEIAQLYKEAGRDDQATTWAEEGAKAFPRQTDARLREFLAEEYHRLDRHEDALALVWQNFLDHPHLGTYQTLKQHADRDQEWPRWREKALAHLGRQGQPDRRVTSRVRWEAGPVVYGSELVAILLWERDVDAAWNEACQRGCTIGQWLELALLRQDGHPEDALRIYQDDVRRLVEAGNAAYGEALDRVQSLRSLLAKMGQEERFAEYVTELRSEYKRKRNFMKLLAALP